VGEWDLKRLTATAVVCVRFVGGARADGQAAQAAVRTYRQRMQEYAGMGHLAAWYARIDEGAVLRVLSPKARRKAEKVMAKARRRTHLQVLSKTADLVAGQRRIVEERPLIVRATQTVSGRPIGEALDLFFRSYVASLAGTAGSCWAAISSSMSPARSSGWQRGHALLGASPWGASMRMIRSSCR